MNTNPTRAQKYRKALIMSEWGKPAVNTIGSTIYANRSWSDKKIICDH